MMDRGIDVSVIVPVYNSQNNIQRCLDSLLRQNHLSIEIIIINDGSTDRSREICIEYRNKSSKIVYIEQENKGVSEARNRGILKARGKYVMFCDSDDYYMENAIACLWENVEQYSPDLVIGGVKKTIYGEVETVYCKNSVIRSKEEKDKMIIELTKNYMLNQMWAKLYRRDIIIKQKILLKAGLTSGEDLEWLCRFMVHANKICITEKIVYHYIVSNQNSLSQKFSSDFFSRIEQSFESLQYLYVQEKMMKQYEDILIERQIRNYWDGLKEINKFGCDMDFREKVNYIASGISSKYYKEFVVEKGKKYIPKIKYTIMKIKNPYLLTLIISILGREYDNFKNKK